MLYIHVCKITCVQNQLGMYSICFAMSSLFTIPLSNIACFLEWCDDPRHRFEQNTWLVGRWKQNTSTPVWARSKTCWCITASWSLTNQYNQGPPSCKLLCKPHEYYSYYSYIMLYLLYPFLWHWSYKRTNLAISLQRGPHIVTIAINQGLLIRGWH